LDSIRFEEVSVTATRLPSGQDQIADMYEALAGRLRQIVRGAVRAPEAVIDDACQAAWSRLLRRRREIRSETALAWLVTTASREALRSCRRAARELPLDELREQQAEQLGLVVWPAGPDEIFGFRQRLDQLRELPRRQQEAMWLQGFGLSYDEIAAYTGDTRRTVERQLMRAKRALESGAGR
jgi:RNA polymerase sigma factor (sigma-70 family)